MNSKFKKAFKIKNKANKAKQLKNNYSIADAFMKIFGYKRVNIRKD